MHFLPEFSSRDKLGTLHIIICLSLQNCDTGHTAPNVSKKFSCIVLLLSKKFFNIIHMFVLSEFQFWNWKFGIFLTWFCFPSVCLFSKNSLTWCTDNDAPPKEYDDPTQVIWPLESNLRFLCFLLWVLAYNVYLPPFLLWIHFVVWLCSFLTLCWL